MSEQNQDTVNESELSKSSEKIFPFTAKQVINLLQVDPSRAHSSYEKLGKVSGHMPADD